LAIVHQDFDGHPSTIAKNEQTSGEGIGLQRLLTNAGQAIDPVPKIDGTRMRIWGRSGS